MSEFRTFVPSFFEPKNATHLTQTSNYYHFILTIFAWIILNGAYLNSSLIYMSEPQIVAYFIEVIIRVITQI